ncbi:MAG: hypothetical protein P8176_01375 [Gammaproteobacteria bacterium]
MEEIITVIEKVKIGHMFFVLSLVLMYLGFTNDALLNKLTKDRFYSLVKTIFILAVVVTLGPEFFSFLKSLSSTENGWIMLAVIAVSIVSSYYMHHSVNSSLEKRSKGETRAYADTDMFNANFQTTDVQLAPKDEADDRLKSENQSLISHCKSPKTSDTRECQRNTLESAALDDCISHEIADEIVSLWPGISALLIKKHSYSTVIECFSTELEQSRMDLEDSQKIRLLSLLAKMHQQVGNKTEVIVFLLRSLMSNTERCIDNDSLARDKKTATAVLKNLSNTQTNGTTTI